MTQDDDVEREVVEETVEETETLDQSSLSHEERREQEREALEAGGRVSLSEADWTRRTEEDRDEIRQAVDDLEVDDEPRTFDPVPPAPGVAVPDEVEDAPAGLTLTGERDQDVAPLSRADREAIEDAYEGEIVQALALYEARRGRVVRVVHDRGEGLEEDKAIVDDGEVRDLGSIVEDVDAIGADVDLSDLDESELAPAEDEADEASVDEVEAAEAEAAADEVEEEAGEGLGARIGGLLDRGGDEDEDDAGEEADEAGDAGELEEPEDEPEPAEEADEAPDEDEGGLRDRVSGLLDRGDEDEPDDEPGDEAAPEPEESEPDEAPEDEPDEDDDEGGGLRDRVGGLLDRGGDEDEADEPEASPEPEGEGAGGDDAGDEGEAADEAFEGTNDGDGDETGS